MKKLYLLLVILLIAGSVTLLRAQVSGGDIPTSPRLSSSDYLTEHGRNIYNKAKSGDANSQSELAFFLYNGIEANINYHDVLYWAKKAADQKNPCGAFYLGHCYNFGMYVRKNTSVAKQWYNKAFEWANARKNSTDKYVLGMLYNYGWGVYMDKEAAFRWFNMSADEGNAKGQYRMGLAYYLGEGTEKKL